MMMKRFIVLLLFNACASWAALAQVAEGDRHYAMRAEGAVGGRAKAEHIDAAIAAFSRGSDLESQWKLLRAYRFKGAYVAATTDEKKKIYGAAKVAGEKALAAVNKALGVKPTAPEKDVAAKARALPGAAEVFLWDAVNWGEWALAYGKLAAAREGAADRIRREATIAHLADPKLEGGAPSRVLGRLHDQTPRIPFITGWASEKEAVKFLTESQRIDPPNKITLVFLAEAMVANDSKTKPQAIKILRDVIASPNDPNYAVEWAAATEDAKALLKKLER
jgi:hypothetical protein